MPDGWLHTGDLGTMDASGRLRIVGRKKDMFIVGGFNAYPAEIEGFLMQHPAVAQAAVIGVPDERMGQVGKAFVVLAAGESVSEDELIAWARERMAGFKVPRAVRFLDALPLNATGKVQKDLLHKQNGRRYQSSRSQCRLPPVSQHHLSPLKNSVYEAFFTGY